MMTPFIERAKVLIEALPYIQRFNNQIVVIKYGGSAMENPQIQETIIQDIVLMKQVGIHPVIVHGGGPEINRILDRLNIPSEFITGLRVTTAETIEVVEMVLTGKVNKQIVELLHKYSGRAVGLSGKDGKLLTATKLLKNDVDLGFVGEITDVNPEVLTNLIAGGFIPVISPIASDGAGGTLNVNADYAAVAIAAALKAKKLVFLTDVEGVFLDKDRKETVLSELDDVTALQYIESGVIKGGMIPKVECCVQALHDGVEQVHLLDGRMEHSLLLEVYTKDGIGTVFYKGEC